ncbi:MAG: hypothetical protein ACREN6_16340 [Gemmatimonadaceae bacterium]
MTPNIPFFSARIPRVWRTGALFALVALVGACDGPSNIPGQSENATQAFFVHALSDPVLDGSTALAFPARAVTRVDGTFNFDVAFDIDSAGNVKLLPPEVLGQNPAGNRLVGIITGIGSYDDITSAPLSGYTVDSATVVVRGQAVAVQAQEPLCISSNPGAPYLYAKLVIDSVDVAGHGIYGRTMIGGDCGYRQLVPGFPAF